MPIGCYAMVPEIAHQLCLNRPQRVLDLGIGFGGNGAIVRQWLDAGVKPWQTYLVGVEAWPQYRNPAWDLYNLIVADTIQRYLAELSETFDFVLLTDVIEHFVKEDGFRLIDALRRCLRPGGTLLVGTPAVFFPQAAVYGNPYEIHRSVWDETDFESLGFRAGLIGRPDYFCGQAWCATWRRPAAD